MLSEDSFQYALENTHVVRAPQQRIETFGQTSFHFSLVSELMDSVHQVRVREGSLHVDRPQILTPGYFPRTLLEGFGDRAEEFVDWLRVHGRDLAIIQYGFQFRKTGVSETLIHSPIDEVLDRLQEKAEKSEDPMCAVLRGVDEGWEVCLLKFAVDLIQQSAGRNLDDFRKRGLF
jgi:hypothetical protein